MVDKHDSTEGADRRIVRRLAWVFGGLALVLGAVAVYGALHGWPQALARMRATGKFNVDAYVEWGEFWACAVNAVLCAGLAVGMRKGWGMRNELPTPNAERRTLNVEGEIPHSEFRIPNFTWVWLAIILTAAGALRWARMDLSLYNDEAHTFRTYIAGRFKEPDAKGVQKWRQVTWKETFFMNKVGNNLTPCSALGRVCYDGWKKMTHARDGAVCETALRLPVLLSGLGSLLVLWLVMRRLAGGLASWCFLLLGAVHPWHVRYSTEARGYGLMLLGVSLCFYFVQRALEDGRWRWWLGLGAAQCLCVWSFPGAVYWLVVFNALLVLGLAAAAWKRKTGWHRLVRLSVGLICGGMLTLQVMLPTAAQLSEIMTQLDSLKGAMGLLWWKDALSGAALGLRWVDSDVLNEWNATGSRVLALHPWLWVSLVGVAVASICGAVKLSRRGVVGFLLAASGPIAVVLSWALMLRKGTFLHPWYVLYAVPGFLACLALAVAGRRNSLWKGGAALLLCACLAPWWLEADRLFLSMSKENLKGVSQAIRHEAGSGEFLLGGVFTDVDVYEGRVNILHDVGELDAIINEARSSKRKLIVTYGREGLMQVHLPTMLKRLQDKGEFRPVSVLHGLEEEQFTHRVVVWVPQG